MSVPKIDADTAKNTSEYKLGREDIQKLTEISEGVKQSTGRMLANQLRQQVAMKMYSAAGSECALRMAETLAPVADKQIQGAQPISPR